MIIDKDAALTVLLEEADAAAEGNVNPEWEARIEEFSQICESTSKTHIALPWQQSTGTKDGLMRPNPSGPR